MAESGSHNLGFRLDIKQILLEAQHRWLRPAEICEILRNHHKFHISPEPPHRPVSGSVFLFDRKVLRYFRKDGHNWRKKKDGKTVKEAHEKLKVGSIDMLHCYYAHGEENENFQRRSYWMLEQDLMHIVFVHYLEVKGNKTNINYLSDTDTVSSNSQNDSSMSFSSSRNDQLASTYADTSSPNSTLTSTYVDAECVQLNAEDNHLGRSRIHSYPETSQAKGIHLAEDAGIGLSSSHNLDCLGTQTIPSVEYMPFPTGHGGGGSYEAHCVSGVQRTLELASWQEVLERCTAGGVGGEQGSWNSPELQANWQEDSSINWQEQSGSNQMSSSSSNTRGNFWEQKSDLVQLQKFEEPFYTSPDVHGDHLKHHTGAQPDYMKNDKAENCIDNLGTGNCSSVSKKSHLSGVKIEEDGLKKVDSFSHWMAKELGEVDGFHLMSNNGYSWSELQTEDLVAGSCLPTQLQLDADTLNFSLSQDQLFSIIDFSPTWAYSNSKTKVLTKGRFLINEQDFVRCRWACMFGEVEVPAEVLADGVLCCHAPEHKAGLVPFYVTCSNRVACSEVREFEYRPGPQDTDFIDHTSYMHLQERFERLLLTEPVGSTSSFLECVAEKQDMVKKIISLMEDDDSQRVMITSGRDVYLHKKMEGQEAEKPLQDKFYSWLLEKVTVDGKGPSIVDEEGQGMLHLSAALGYNWALKPIIISGVSIDFRDVNGWTALHWAALYGREDTVVALVSLGAASGALTDPSAEYPLGRTPADLASANGHKGISGFLAECALTSQLSSLTMNDSEKDETLETQVKAIQTVSDRVVTPFTEEDVPDSLSLKDTLAAVCNATQAAARIHQIYRIQSFQRKQVTEQDNNEPCSSEELALSVLAAKTCRLGQNETARVAAISIQKKYRGWKKRKEFLKIRERIVIIQAHVRGHQARKKYKPIIWSVGILEKVILRWRRKGSGLRGFRKDAITKDPSTQDVGFPEDDYDFLKEGRKQTEERLQKALARVKSMAQYPEARAQYRRLLTVAEGFHDSKDASGMVSEGYDVNYPEADQLDVETLLDDDAFMSIAFE